MSKPARAGALAACAILAVMSAASGVAAAAQAVPVASDAALEARVAALSGELRCLVCQNQSLADSNAPLAVDLKNQVRAQLQAGRTEAQVVEFMTARYGDFVLYRPPVKATTWLLWAGPAVMLLGGLAWLGRQLARRAGASQPLAEDDAAQADALLAAPDSDLRR